MWWKHSELKARSKNVDVFVKSQLPTRVKRRFPQEESSPPGTVNLSYSGEFSYGNPSQRGISMSDRNMCSK